MDDRIIYYLTYYYLDKRGYRREINRTYYNKETLVKEYGKLLDKMGQEKGPVEKPHITKSVNGEMAKVFNIEEEMQC